jgi:DNA-binding transcriptional regulator YiaG
MPNIAAVLKSEISRIARKEIKQQTTALKQSAGSYRRELAALKRRIQALEAELKGVKRGTARPAPAAEDTAQDAPARIGSKALATLRKRLGLSAADFGRLIGASALSVYKWEQGKARPRAKFLAAIAQVRGLGKREVAARLQAQG